jgi:arsenate reductase
MRERPTILFLCTGNSCRSQMAEGLARDRWGDRYEFFSAGMEKHGLNELAVDVMGEIGIDISHHQSQALDEFAGLEFDYVITVCGHADETCPVFPGNTRKLHAGFDDPPKLAADCETREEKLPHYRRVRDEIRDFVDRLPTALDPIKWGHS